MLMMKSSDEELELITNQFVEEDTPVFNSPDEAEIWMNEYLSRFYDEDESASG